MGKRGLAAEMLLVLKCERGLPRAYRVADLSCLAGWLLAGTVGC